MNLKIIWICCITYKLHGKKSFKNENHICKCNAKNSNAYVVLVLQKKKKKNPNHAPSIAKSMPRECSNFLALAFLVRLSQYFNQSDDQMTGIFK